MSLQIRLYRAGMHAVHSNVGSCARQRTAGKTNVLQNRLVTDSKRHLHFMRQAIWSAYCKLRVSQNARYWGSRWSHLAFENFTSILKRKILEVYTVSHEKQKPRHHVRPGWLNCGQLTNHVLTLIWRQRKTIHQTWCHWPTIDAVF